MFVTYKYKLYETKKLKYIHNKIDISGIIYNHCIALHKRYYRIYKKHLNMFQLQKHLTKLKKLNNTISLKGYRYKFWLSRPIKGKIKTVTIKRDSLEDIYICISLEQEEKKISRSTGNSVGIDFGLKKFLTLSDKQSVESPLFHLQNLSKIKKLNRNLSKKVSNLVIW